MNRNIGIERVYSLGDYKSIRVLDSIDNIPDELMLNQDFVDALRKLQLVNADLVFQEYYAQVVGLSSMKDGSGDKINALIELRANTFEQIQKILNKE